MAATPAFKWLHYVSLKVFFLRIKWLDIWPMVILYRFFVLSSTFVLLTWKNNQLVLCHRLYITPRYPHRNPSHRHSDHRWVEMSSICHPKRMMNKPVNKRFIGPNNTHIEPHPPKPMTWCSFVWPCWRRNRRRECGYAIMIAHPIQNRTALCCRVLYRGKSERGSLS